jgi:hypothetical protein|tara:strand:+ start:2979 stop:3116 length:138 start_codon:yes stop_codon:yes gene_type:complete
MNIVNAFKSNFKKHLDKPTNKSPVSKIRRRNQATADAIRKMRGGK